MLKAVFCITRKDGMTHEEFVEYWHNEHVPLAKRHPGLRKYATSVPESSDAAPFDGIAELYFDSASALQAGLVESDVGQEAKADALVFTDPEKSTMYLVEETVHLDDR